MIISKNHNGELKHYGGDYWHVRVQNNQPVENRLMIPPARFSDFGNGTYLIEFPDLTRLSDSRQYILQITLDRPSEVREIVRRALSSIHIVGRKLTANLSKFNSKTPTFGECGPFPMPGSCNFSISQGRSWYCRGREGVADCEKSENDWKKTGELLMRKTLVPWKMSDILKKLVWENVDGLKKTVEKEGYLQTKKLLLNITAQRERHTQYSDEELMVVNRTRYCKVFSTPLTKNQLYDEIVEKTEGKSIVMISASLGRYVADFYRDIYQKHAEAECTTDNKLYLTTKLSHKCEKTWNDKHGMHPRKTTCIRFVGGKKIETDFYFIPHGKPLHHGGCEKRMPWMVDSIESLSDDFLKRNKTGSDIKLLIGTGPHFSAVNPIYFYRRLVELRPVLYKFKQQFPLSKIIYKTPSYYRGNFFNQNAMISDFVAGNQVKIIKYVFSDERIVKVVDVHKSTSLLWDFMTDPPDSGSIHPGTGKSPVWMLEMVGKQVLDEF